MDRFATTAVRRNTPGILAAAWAIAAWLLAAAGACAEWRPVDTGGPGPIRSVVRRADGRFLGPSSVGPALVAWVSDDGARWRQLAEVVRKPGVGFGDPVFLAVPGTDTVFCAAREHQEGRFRVTTYRSDDGGARWAFDSVVDAAPERFVGAPFLFLRQNGDLQCYYDSEPLAAAHGRPGFQWIAMRGRSGLTGPWDHYGLVTVSREEDTSLLTRDGMPTVVSLGDDHLMCVTEGVETRGRGGANVVRAIESRDGGKTWDYANRRILYESRPDAESGRQFNAYAPWAIRLSDGTVWVAFCTDEDFDAPPDFSHEIVPKRRSHIKVIRADAPYRRWTAPETVWDGGPRSYVPGLFERGPGDVLCVVDLLNGSRATLSNPPAATALWLLRMGPTDAARLGRAARAFRAAAGLDPVPASKPRTARRAVGRSGQSHTIGWR